MEQSGYRCPGMDLLVDSSVPVGAGLSSSAALECSVAVAVNDLSQADDVAAIGLAVEEAFSAAGFGAPMIFSVLPGAGAAEDQKRANPSLPVVVAPDGLFSGS
jgi:galactokinase